VLRPAASFPSGRLSSTTAAPLTWVLETHRLGEEGAFTSAIANVVISLLAGLGAASLGRYLGAHG
jgi:fluoride ion exporter CrcB/FEX